MNRRQFLLAAPTAAAALGIAACMKPKPQYAWITGLEARLFGTDMLQREGFERAGIVSINMDCSVWIRERPWQQKELFIAESGKIVYRGIDYATYKWWRGDTGKGAETEYFRRLYEACV